MAVVKNLMVRAGADFSALRKETAKAQQNIVDFKNNISRTMGSIKKTLAVIGIGKMIKDSVAVAMETKSSVRQLGRNMGENAGEFMDWANTQAWAFGFGKAEATKYGATYSNLISGFIKDTKEVTSYTLELMKASSIIADSTSRDITDVMERIRSGMLGSTEAIEDLGINVNVAMLESTDAFKKFSNGKSWQQLSFQTQQQIRLFAILEQSSKKYGNTLSGDVNTRQLTFTATMKNMQLALGQAFLPIYSVILPAITSLIGMLTNAINIVAQFTNALFGQKNKNQVKETSSQTDAVNSLGDAYKSTGKKAKEAKGALAGFDEVNTLNMGSGGGDDADPMNGAASQTDAGSSEISDIDISEGVQSVADKIKTVFANLSSFLKEQKDIVISVLAGLGAAFATFLIVANIPAIISAFETLALKTMYLMDSLKAGLAKALTFLTSPIGLVVLAIGAAVAAFVYFYRTNESFKGKVDDILNKIKDAAIYLWQNVLVPLGKFIADVFVTVWNGLSTALKWTWENVLVPLGVFLKDIFTKAWDTVKIAALIFWENVLVPLGDFLLWLWNNVLVPLGGILADVLGVAFDTVAYVATQLWEKVLVPLGEFLASIFGPAVDALSAVFLFLWQSVLQPIGAFLETIFKPIWSGLIDVIMYLWENVLQPLIKFMAGAFKATFDTVFNSIGGIIEGLKKTFIGLMNFITGVFTGDWKKAWEGVKSIFSGIFETFYNIVKFPLNLIIDAINTVIKGLNKISFDIPSWVPGLGGKTFGINIPPLPKLATGGITDVNNPFAAIVGDNKTQREVVSPLDDLMDMIQSAVGTAMMTATKFNSSNSRQGDIILQIDGTTIARVLNPFNSKESSRIGNAMIVTT